MVASVKRYSKLALKYVILPLIAVCILGIVSALSYRAYLQHQIIEQTKITSPNGIDSLEKVTLGGLEQWILIRGWDKSAPVMLFLHGGPGGGDIAMGRHFHTRLERSFVVVRWDQRGAGKSYNSDIPPESMTIEQFVSDTLELVEILRKRFDVTKIYLVGHSWGSELGCLTVAQRPEVFHAFVGVGQLVEFNENERISYEFALAKANELNNQQAISELENIGPPPHGIEKLMIQRKWLDKFGGVFYSDTTFSDLWKIGITSPDCSLFDGYRYFRGQFFSLENMWEDDVSKINLFELAPKIEVPIYFFIGRHDYNTPFEIAVKYYESLEAPNGKQLIWFENSAHMVPIDEPDKFCDILINTVLKETYTSME
jgi:pimeloyl-ACP methyl ester carboxylesterase